MLSLGTQIGSATISCGVISNVDNVRLVHNVWQRRGCNFGLSNESLSRCNHTLALVHKRVAHANSLLNGILGGLDIWCSSLLLKILACNLESFKAGVKGLCVITIDERLSDCSERSRQRVKSGLCSLVRNHWGEPLKTSRHCFVVVFLVDARVYVCCSRR
jgi:hypothetical protein